MTIAEHREQRRLDDLRIKQKGIEVYNSFDKSERTCVQFGMFPHYKMLKADAELLAEFQGSNSGYDKSDLARLLAVAIMDAANAGTDKMVV